jgi:hypothetical protein
MKPPSSMGKKLVGSHAGLAGGGRPIDASLLFAAGPAAIDTEPTGNIIYYEQQDRASNTN